MREKQGYFSNAELLLLGNLHLTTHHTRQCPFCHGKVYREKRAGFSKLAIVLALRPYRCEACDKLHYGFCF